MHKASSQIRSASSDLAEAIESASAISVSRQSDYSSSLRSWHVNRDTLGHTFTRQALGVVWDFAEVFPFSGSTGDADLGKNLSKPVSPKNSSRKYLSNPCSSTRIGQRPHEPDAPARHTIIYVSTVERDGYAARCVPR